MNRAFKFFLIAVGLLVLIGPAYAEISVSITSVAPSDGRIGEGQKAIISWTINADSESGNWQFEIGGDGTWGSGDKASSSDASGTFGGTTQGSSTINASELTDGDGDYTVYFIAQDSSDSEVYDSTSTTLTLDNPPSTVTGVSAGNGTGKVFINWDEHHDSDIDHFLVYYDTQSGSDAADYLGNEASEGPSPVDAGNATSFTLNGLENEVRIYVRVSAVDEGGAEGPLSEEVASTPRESFGVTGISEEEGCFIATAAFGSKDHAAVRSLRRYRDAVLMGKSWGRAFVRLYYRTSPPAARWLADHPRVKTGVRVSLIPLAWYAQVSTAHTAAALMIPLLFLLVFTASFSYAVVRVRRRDK